MYVKEIERVKEHLDNLKSEGLITDWELPYENLLTRLNAAIFFVTPASGSNEQQLWQEMSGYSFFSYRPNDEKKLSSLEYRVTFNEEELKKNADYVAR
jgi:hypothetical protein